MDLKDIKAIIDLMKKNSITEFELEEKDSKLRLKRGLNGSLAAIQPPEESIFPAPSPAPFAAMVATTPLAQESAPANSGEIEIKSPMIGTLYRSPSPESGPYVDVGTEVNTDTVVCIIEANLIRYFIYQNYLLCTFVFITAIKMMEENDPWIGL